MRDIFLIESRMVGYQDWVVLFADTSYEQAKKDLDALTAKQLEVTICSQVEDSIGECIEPSAFRSEYRINTIHLYD